MPYTRLPRDSVFIVERKSKTSSSDTLNVKAKQTQHLPHIFIITHYPTTHLTTETVQSPSLPFEGIDDVERGDGLSLCVLGVGNCISDDALEEGLEDTACLFVDHCGDTLDTTTARETADGRLGDALDVVTENLAMAFGAAFPEALATFSTSRHSLFEID